MEKWVIYAIVSMIFAGLTSVLAKYGMEGMKSDNALAIRTAKVFLIIITNALIFNSVWTELQKFSGKNILFLSFQPSPLPSPGSSITGP